MLAYLKARFSERVSQAAIAAFLSSVAVVASQPAAWAVGSLPMWLSLIQPGVVCLIAVLVPEGIGATVASLSALIPPPTGVKPPAAVTVQMPPPAPTGAGSAVALLLAICLMGFGLSACSNAPQTINDGITTANTDVATLNRQYLGNACAVLALAHDGFQIASDLSPDVAANKPAEAQVYAALIGPTGLCSAASIANPPSDVAAALKAAYAQIAAFIPNLPQLPAPPASVAPVAPTAPAS